MGNIQSNQTKQVLSDFTTYINSVVSNTYNSAINQCSSGNTFTLQTGGSQYCDFVCDGCTFNIDQVAGTTCALNSTNLNSANANFTNNIQNNIKQFITQGSQNTQGWFATAFSLQIQGAETADQVSNLVSNNLTANFTNICTDISTALNSAQVTLCGTYNQSVLNLNQNALVSAVTSCVNKNITSMFTTNSTLNTLWMQTDQKLASTQSGFSFKWIGIALGILLLLLILGAGGYYIFKRKKNPELQIAPQIVQ